MPSTTVVVRARIRGMVWLRLARTAARLLAPLDGQPGRIGRFLIRMAIEHGVRGEIATSEGNVLSTWGMDAAWTEDHLFVTKVERR